MVSDFENLEARLAREGLTTTSFGRHLHYYPETGSTSDRMAELAGQDGGNIVLTLLPPKIAYRYAASRSYGMLILYALMLSGALWYVLGPPYEFLRSMLIG